MTGVEVDDVVAASLGDQGVQYRDRPALDFLHTVAEWRDVTVEPHLHVRQLPHPRAVFRQSQKAQTAAEGIHTGHMAAIKIIEKVNRGTSLPRSDFQDANPSRPPRRQHAAPNL